MICAWIDTSSAVVGLVGDDQPRLRRRSARAITTRWRIAAGKTDADSDRSAARAAWMPVDFKEVDRAPAGPCAGAHRQVRQDRLGELAPRSNTAD